VVRYDGSAGKRHALTERLQLAGLDVDTTGQDWLTVRDMEPAVSASAMALNVIFKGSADPSIEKAELVAQIDELLAIVEQMRKRSGFEDLSDLKNESLQFVFRAQALFDKFANHSPYAAEVAKVSQQRPSVRLPVLEAALQSLRGDLVDRA
jgi:hypothetical protein